MSHEQTNPSGNGPQPNKRQKKFRPKPADPKRLKKSWSDNFFILSENSSSPSDTLAKTASPAVPEIATPEPPKELKEEPAAPAPSSPVESPAGSPHSEPDPTKEEPDDEDAAIEQFDLYYNDLEEVEEKPESEGDEEVAGLGNEEPTQIDEEYPPEDGQEVVPIRQRVLPSQPIGYTSDLPFDDGEMMDDSDIEMLEEVKGRPEISQGIVVEEVKEVAVEKPASEGESELDKTLRKYLTQQRRRTTDDNSFEVTVQIEHLAEDMKPLDMTLTVRSNEPFRKLKDQYLEQVKQRKVSDAVYDWAKEHVFIFNDVRLVYSATPAALNIKSYENNIAIKMMTPDAYEKYLEKRKLEDAEKEERTVNLEEEEDDDDEEVEMEGSVAAEEEGNEEDANDGYFPIKLKSSDNKVIRVAVRAETEIRKLADKFIADKQLPPGTKLRLEFDDEPIDMGGTIGDTEMEEEDEIHVHIV